VIGLGLRDGRWIEIQQELDDPRLEAGRKGASRVQDGRAKQVVVLGDGRSVHSRWIGLHHRLDGPERGPECHNAVQGKVVGLSTTLGVKVVPNPTAPWVVGGVPVDGIVVVLVSIERIPGTELNQIVEIGIPGVFFLDVKVQIFHVRKIRGFQGTAPRGVCG